jgi:hypothetical protein
MKKYIYFLILFVIFACNNTNTIKTTQEIKEPFIQLPENAIPFIFDNYIFIKMRINDSIIGNFIFDSGSDQLYLDSSFVSRNNIPVNRKRKKKIRGVGANTPRVPIVSNLKMSLDTLMHIYNDVPVTDIRGISNKKIDGIFGTDFFQEYALKINFDSCFFQIIKPSELIVSEEYDTVNFDMVENKVFIWCKVLTVDTVNIEGWTMLDLGSGHALTLTSVIADEYNLNKIIKNKYSYPQKNAGYGGGSHSYYFRAKNIRIGDYTLNKPVINYSTDKKGALSFWGMLGLLGTKIMHRFDLILDFPNEKLYLKQNSQFNNPYYSNSTGFYGKLYNDEWFIVENVIANSPAQKAGIISGDTISHLNGLKISSYSRPERQKLFQQDTIEVEIILKRNNNSHKIKILPKELL